MCFLDVYMIKKKVVKCLFFLCLSLFSSSVSAQSSVLEQIKEMDLQELLRVYSSLPQYGVKTQELPSVSTYAMMRSVGHTATERVRIPDLSPQDGEVKWYYIKNVETGEYLHYEGGNSPLKTVKIPDAASKFYLRKHGLPLSSGGGSLHNYCSNGKILESVSSNSWIEVTGRLQAPIDPIVRFIPADNGYGCYIVDDFIDEKKECWHYDVATGNVVVGEKDEYSVWTIEALPETPVVSTEADSVWYVVKNVNTGRYLHYEGALSPMSLVKSPDPCSLFFVLDVDGDAGEEVELHNYEAGELSYSGANQWSTVSAPIQFVRNGVTDQFFIKENGGATVWYENSGILAMGASGSNSLWEFEKIADFKEIFGFCYNGEEYNKVINRVYESLNSEEEGLAQSCYELIKGILTLLVMGNNTFTTPEVVVTTKESFDDIPAAAGIPEISADAYDDLKIYNVSYIDDETGETLMRGLSTNSSSLLINNVDYSHTNVWQMQGRFVDLSSDILSDISSINDAVYSIKLYNTVTGKYITAPVEGEGGE